MPSLQDDGRTVTLDLHGAIIDDALALAEQTIREAARRGRSSVKLVHGSSTSSRQYRNRTIKHALHDWLDGGGPGGLVTGDLRAEGYTTCSLDVTTGTHDAAPIRMLDITR